MDMHLAAVVLIWLCVAFVVIVTVISIILVNLIRKRRLLSLLHVEIENQGNVESRYQLLAEDPSGGLRFTFQINGQPLNVVIKSDGTEPPPPPPPPPAPKRSSREDAEQAIGVTGTIANILMGLGSLLGKVGKPLVQIGSKMRSAQATAFKAKMVSDETASLTGGQSSSSGRSTKQSAAPLLHGIAWAETYSVKPGNKVIVDLKVQSGYVPTDVTRPFKLKSQPTEAPAPAMTEVDGVVRIRGGFFSHKVYPSLTILLTATLLLGLIYGLVRLGVLN